MSFPPPAKPVQDQAKQLRGFVTTMPIAETSHPPSGGLTPWSCGALIVVVPWLRSVLAGAQLGDIGREILQSRRRGIASRKRFGDHPSRLTEARHAQHDEQNRGHERKKPQQIVPDGQHDDDRYQGGRDGYAEAALSVEPVGLGKRQRRPPNDQCGR
jgi:hypothetical protein